VSGFEPECPVLGRLVWLKISATYVHRSRPSIFGSRTDLGTRSSVRFIEEPTWQPYVQAWSVLHQTADHRSDHFCTTSCIHTDTDSESNYSSSKQINCSSTQFMARSWGVGVLSLQEL